MSQLLIDKKYKSHSKSHFSLSVCLPEEFGRPVQGKCLENDTAEIRVENRQPFFAMLVRKMAYKPSKNLDILIHQDDNTGCRSAGLEYNSE